MTAAQSLRLRDPSEFRELSNWDVELTQMEPGELETRVSVWAGKNLTLIDLSFDKAVHQTGTSRQGTLAVGLPDPQRVSKWLGQAPSPTCVMNFGNDQPFDGVGARAFSGVVFEIDAGHAQRLADNCGLDISATLKGAAFSMMGNAGAHHSRLKRMARCRLTGSPEAFSLGEEDDMILALLEMLSLPRAWTDNSKSSQRCRAARMAVEYMVANLEESISIGQICAEIGVSAPTLRRGFLETYGIGPKQFFLRYRLGRVRTQLDRMSGDCGIADVANSYGFWHMGQFARDYRTLFGELPSQTLRENGRC